MVASLLLIITVAIAYVEIYACQVLSVVQYVGRAGTYIYVKVYLHV